MVVVLLLGDRKREEDWVGRDGETEKIRWGNERER